MTGAKKQSGPSSSRLRRHYGAGTTLFELMITITVFSIFFTVGVQLLASALKNHQQALAKAEVLNQTSYVLDYMSRSFRMAQKDITGDCISQNYNFENPNNDISAIRFLSYQNKCTEFLTSDVEKNGKTYTLIMTRRSTNGDSDNLGAEVALSAIGPSVSKLSFFVTGKSQSDVLQPSVTIALEFKDSLLGSPVYNIQTTISQRELDVEY